VRLNVHGVTVELDGDAGAVAELEAHFSWFVACAGARPPDVRIELLREPGRVDSASRLLADQVLERGLVYNEGDVTWVDHHGHGVSRYDFESEHGRISAPAQDDLVELGYLMVHSRLGVLLERRGFCRLHALGVCLGGSAAVVLTPSGGGKSHLALALLELGKVQLLGDDIVLIDRDALAYPFPHPIGIPSESATRGLGTARAFRRRHHVPKWILQLDRDRVSIASNPAPIRAVVIARRTNRGPSRVVPVSKRVVLSALFRDMVIGLGLPQVVELLARHGVSDVVRLAPSAARRALVGARVAGRARGLLLELGDAESAAKALQAELRSSAG
jgi:hypothetical protein